MNKLRSSLKYTFKNIGLLELALTHKSFSKINNERLEFLGDAILNSLISEILFNKYQTLSEGKLTQLRASLVSRTVLNKMGKDLKLSNIIKLGPGESFDNNSIIGNALEAIIAAIYLDGGYSSCLEVVESIFNKTLSTLHPDDDKRDSKSKLQEYLQQEGLSLPIYEIVKDNTMKEGKRFEVICKLTELNISSKGFGKNKKNAEMSAAKKALVQISKS